MSIYVSSDPWVQPGKKSGFQQLFDINKILFSDGRRSTDAITLFNTYKDEETNLLNIGRFIKVSQGHMSACEITK